MNVPAQARCAATTAGAPLNAAAGALPASLLDEIGSGLIVCDARGDIVYANLAARNELAGMGLLLQSARQLRRAPGTRGDIEAALEHAVHRGRRSLVPLVKGSDRLLVSVVPLPLPERGERQVLVLLGRREPCSDLALEMLAGCHALTGAERRVLAGLLRNASPRQIAARNGVSVTTVRCQISTLRSKLGVRNVEGLLLLAAGVPPVASALRIAATRPLPVRAPEPTPELEPVHARALLAAA